MRGQKMQSWLQTNICIQIYVHKRYLLFTCSFELTRSSQKFKHRDIALSTTRHVHDTLYFRPPKIYFRTATERTGATPSPVRASLRSQSGPVKVPLRHQTSPAGHFCWPDRNPTLRSSKPVCPVLCYPSTLRSFPRTA
jgi:hypothetical protein